MIDTSTTYYHCWKFPRHRNYHKPKTRKLRVIDSSGWILEFDLDCAWNNGWGWDLGGLKQVEDEEFISCVEQTPGVTWFRCEHCGLFTFRRGSKRPARWKILEPFDYDYDYCLNGWRASCPLCAIGRLHHREAQWCFQCVGYDRLPSVSESWTKGPAWTWLSILHSIKKHLGTESAKKWQRLHWATGRALGLPCQDWNEIPPAAVSAYGAFKRLKKTIKRCVPSP